MHRIVPGVIAQGGAGGPSVHGAPFADESFALTHHAPGVLSMASAGPGTNGRLVHTNTHHALPNTPCSCPS